MTSHVRVHISNLISAWDEFFCLAGKVMTVHIVQHILSSAIICKNPHGTYCMLEDINDREIG